MLVRSAGYLAIALLLAIFGLVLVEPVLDSRAADGKTTKDAPAKDVPLALRGARIHTASGPVIERGVLVVHKGKIVAVGSEEAVTIPPGAEIRDLTGKTLIPGL